MSAAAIKGDYVDLRFVKGRKVLQIVVECPIEAGPSVVQAFGTPNPETNIPVALARLNEEPKPEPVKERRSFDELRPSQQAGMLCQQGDFRTFLAERSGCTHFKTLDIDMAADDVREHCEVHSRADLDTNPTAAGLWQSLRAEFEAWKQL